MPLDASGLYLTLEDAASESDLFLNLAYHSHPGVIERFRRSALVDTDPGLVQTWMDLGQLDMARHDVYFTIGETVGTPKAHFPGCGLQWHYTPPPVFLPAWPPTQAGPSAAFTTVSNWWGDYMEFQGEILSNEKRTSFLEYLELPSETKEKLELALTLGFNDANEAERRLLEQRGWRVRSPWTDGGWNPDEYRIYVQGSRGEFSCAKPFYVLLESSLIFDRTLHYLASGKPAIVQYTGPSKYLPDSGGLFLFRNLKEASQAFSVVESDYDQQCQMARSIASEFFDARTVIKKVLEIALT